MTLANFAKSVTLFKQHQVLIKIKDIESQK